MKQATDGPFKININSGPAAVANWCQDEYYGEPGSLRADIAEAFNHELRWLADQGARFIQLTEQTYLGSAGQQRWAVDLMNRAARGVKAHLTWHMCYGNSRESDSLYPGVNASCLAELFASGQSIDWHEIHMETARPEMSEVGALSAWTARDGKYLGIGVLEVMNPHVETPGAGGGPDPGCTRTCGRRSAHHQHRLRPVPASPRSCVPQAAQPSCRTRIVRRELGRRVDGTP